MDKKQKELPKIDCDTKLYINFTMLKLVEGAIIAKNQSLASLKVLVELGAIHDKVLLDNNVSSGTKEEVTLHNEATKRLVTCIQNDSTNLSIYKIIPPMFRGIRGYVTVMEKRSTQEPALLNHLDGYYTVLGKFAVICSRTKDISKRMSKLPSKE